MSLTVGRRDKTWLNYGTEGTTSILGLRPNQNLSRTSVLVRALGHPGRITMSVTIKTRLLEWFIKIKHITPLQVDDPTHFEHINSNEI